MNNSMTDIKSLRLAFPGGPSSMSSVLRGLNIPALLVLGFPCLFAAWLGLTTYAAYGMETAIGIAVGSASVIAMSEALILAARPRFLEPLLGGLDRMYRAHKWLGISAFVLMILHDIIEPDFERSVRETTLGEIAEEAGELAFYALLTLIAISWFRRLPFIRLEIPYQLWRFSHRFMGVLFAIVAFHQFFIDMPTNVDPSLSMMLDAFCIAGLLAWLHIEFTAPLLRRRKFTVNHISHFKDSIKIELAPLGRSMRWRPGQFVFVSCPEAGLVEPHPFTIASAPCAKGTMTLAVRTLGDWTRRLPTVLKEGMSMRVEGPYGRFNFRKGRQRQVWLAGGIGITPFIAWAESLSASEERDIHLVVCVRILDEAAIGRPVLEAAQARNSRFSFQIIATAQAGRLTAQRLTASTPFPVGTADLWFCGPTGLREDVLKGLAALGQTPKGIRYEHFEFA